jgi:serine/threonine-protein phosphatase PGAM5
MRVWARRLIWSVGALSVSGVALAQTWDFDWDKQHASYLHIRNEIKSKSATGEPHVKKKMRIRNLLLIRHGQYLMERPSEQQTLTELGKEQLELTARRLVEMKIPISKIHVSTMPRAVESGEIISKAFSSVPVQYSDLIREGKPAEPDPPRSSFKGKEHALWRESAVIEAGFRALFYRDLQVVEEQESQETFEIVVCHANVIRYMTMRALQLDPQAWLRMGLYHGSITWLRVLPSGECTLRTLGDSGHIPADKLSK